MAFPIKRVLLSGLVVLSIPVALPAALRYFRTPPRFSEDEFFVDHGLAQKTGHEYKARSSADGFHLRLYMAGVGQEDAKVYFEGGDLVAEGLKKTDFEDEDDILMRYRVNSPPDELFDLNETKFDIKNGLMKVFVPRRG
ncbi:hypothetical protein CASFOL_024663 [Castilleja foliolosa]|uniref:SHSP domain-containing protein n=1 Tax=Castilleja foliolosa TaxID=1961234 RepID=A0ABD3CQ58_9LAMI